MHLLGEDDGFGAGVGFPQPQEMPGDGVDLGRIGAVETDALDLCELGGIEVGVDGHRFGLRVRAF